jgi:hypothetical protein
VRVVHADVEGGFLNDAVNPQDVGECLVFGVPHRETNPHFFAFGLFCSPTGFTPGGLVASLTEHAHRHTWLNQALEDPQIVDGLNP